MNKEDFLAYEAVRVSGVTNMFDVGTVSRLSGLSRKVVLEIMYHYSELKMTYAE